MRENNRSLLPLYVATFVILLCGVSAVNSTIENPSLTFFSTLFLILGVGSSLWMRIQGADQRVVVWLATGLAVVLLLLQPSLSDLGRAYLSNPGGSEGISGSGIGIVLEWATVLFSFTLLTNHSLLFSVVPSMALIGLMSSENLNPEIVTYFLGFVLATVFLMGYEAYLERASASLNADSRPAALRPFLALAAGVVMGAFVLGYVASAPLKVVGRQVFSVAANNLPSPSLPLQPLSITGTSSTVSLSGVPPNLSNAEVMRIKSPVSMYWRGTVYEAYDGTTWTDSSRYDSIQPNIGSDEYESDFHIFTLDPNRELRGLKSRTRLEQTITAFNYQGVIHAAADPYSIRGPMATLQTNSRLTAKTPDSPTSPQISYSVTSLVSTATPEQLRAAPAFRSLLAHPEQLAEAHFDYPNYPRNPNPLFLDRIRRATTGLSEVRHSEELEDVRKWAHDRTDGATNDYDRAKAIETYLKSHYVYTLEPPMLPEHTDAAAFFILHSRKGYCEQFANAMVVSLRLLGIPARFVGGYAPGTYDSKSQEWIVRELDAHAWVEVFFPNYGWITFDPTGGVEAEQPGFFSFKTLLNRISKILASRQLLPTLVLFSIFGVFAYVFKTEAYDRYLRAPLQEFLQWWRNRESPDPGWVIERNYRRLQKALGKNGIAVTPSRTPLEVQQEALEQLTDFSEIATPLEKLTQVYTEAVYSGRPPAPGSDGASTLWIQQIEQELKAQGKAKTRVGGN